MITAYVDYGLIQKDHDYPIVSEGYDWYKIRVKGRTVCVFKWIFKNDRVYSD